MFKATRAIYDALKTRDNLKVFTEENERSSEVWLQFTVDNGSPYRIKFISTDDDNDVAVRVFALIQVKEEKKPQVINVLNELNAKFRYAKFCCDSDGDVNIEYDYPVSASNPSESAHEILIRFVKIIDEAYPSLMRALWM